MLWRWVILLWWGVMPLSQALAAEAGLWQQDSLTGDWNGLRAKLADKGIILGADSIDEVFANTAGGVKQGAIYEGRLELLATVDLDRAIGWRGASFHANAFVLQGRGLSANDLNNNLMTVSNIDATRSVRLFTAWIEQALLKGRLSLRIGQIAADDEFLTSDHAGVFINSTFGWPAIISLALPSDGPVYPLATPGVRVKYAVNDRLALAAAVFNGDPAGPGTGDPGARNADGLAFRTGDDAFIIAEACYALNQSAETSGLAVSVKLGAWMHTARFADERIDSSGMSLASPASSGVARMHRDNFGAYLVADQVLWRRPGTADQDLAVFARIAGAPSDRNLISLYGDVGLTLKGAIPTRSDDVAGVAFAYARIGRDVRALDKDAQLLSGGLAPVRDHEATLEITYRFQISPWWGLQLDLQRLFHPGGNVALPQDYSRSVPDATVIGLRSSIVL